MDSAMARVSIPAKPHRKASNGLYRRRYEHDKPERTFNSSIMELRSSRGWDFRSIMLVDFHFRRAQDRPQEELRDLASIADQLGYRAIWVSEAWGRDAFTLLARLIDVVDQAQLATGIVNVWSRSPATLAQAAATLDEACGGRFILGLGVSGARVIEGWHEYHWSKPLSQLQKVTREVRSIIGGERRNGFRLQFQPFREVVPIYWGVYGPESIRAAGEVADGWLGAETPLDLLRGAMAPLHEGAVAAQRPVPPLAYMMQVTVCETDRQRVEATRRMRFDIAFRIGGLGPYHRGALAEHGFGSECEEIARYWRTSDHASAADRVSDRLLNALGCVGSATDCLCFVEQCRQAGVAIPVVTVPRGTPFDRIAATIAACAPAAQL
jgi:5,10-methylenetetrahydromethanopterin reductase